MLPEATLIPRWFCEGSLHNIDPEDAGLCVPGVFLLIPHMLARHTLHH